MATTLRSKMIRLAASFPKGSDERHALLNVLAARSLGPGVHLVEELPALGPNVRIVFRELGSDILRSETVPGYYLDVGGLLKLLFETEKMSGRSEATAKKNLERLLRRL